jgi:hypothetical protein
MKNTRIEQNYIDDSTFLGGFFEFHPEYFANLTRDQYRDLQNYYLLNVGKKTLPERVVDYRRAALACDPRLQARAESAFGIVKRAAGMD